MASQCHNRYYAFQLVLSLFTPPQLLGEDGVYYGSRFGKNIPWVNAWPYNSLRDPQYLGAHSSPLSFGQSKRGSLCSHRKLMRCDGVMRCSCVSDALILTIAYPFAASGCLLCLIGVAPVVPIEIVTWCVDACDDVFSMLFLPRADDWACPCMPLVSHAL